MLQRKEAQVQKGQEQLSKNTDRKVKRGSKSFGNFN